MKPSAAIKELVRWVRLAPSFLETVQQVHSGTADYKTLDEVVIQAKQDYSSEKVNLVGHSYGGILAMDYALDNPKDINYLVTVASCFHGTYGAYWGYTTYLFGIRSPILDDILPDTEFTHDLVAKIGRRLHLLADSGATVCNVVATEDEFVPASSMSLKHPPNITPMIETRVQEGHCESFFCGKTTGLVRRVIDTRYPTILIHPILENSSYFKAFIQTLTPEQMVKTVLFDYDFMAGK